MSAERSGPAICNVSDIGEGKDEMTKASIDLQDLSSTLANLSGVGESVLHASPDMAGNFYTVSAWP
jgi:hypothetical protein